MEEEIKRFALHLDADRHMARNTLVSYKRDLMQMYTWLKAQGVTEAEKVTNTILNSYVLYLEKEGKASTTVSRVMASMKAFFTYEKQIGKISDDPTMGMKAPKVEKKAPTVLTVEEVDRFLAQPKGASAKCTRDRAMLELMYATGLRVSELINLSMDDVNFQIGFIDCHEGGRKRAIPFGAKSKDALTEYLSGSRDKLLKGAQSDKLFINCSGKPMSRQGLWKIIKYYGASAGITTDITPQALRHSFAVHLIRNGADIHAVQEMLGHSDMSTTHTYVSYIQNPGVREEYVSAHPRSLEDNNG